jgi:anionic cell wall polymer biosynthesis LytR-Cps2A-Psr (LCP) family protein
MLETLRESLGIEVHHYLVFKFEGFKRIVDAVGGVELDVPKDMDYEDHWANLSIHLKKGWQHLDGAKAHGFVRFRHDTMGDVGRIERQQMLAKALAQKMKNPSTWKHMPRLLQTLRECVETDLSEDQLASLALFSKGIDTNSFKTEVLPAEWFSPYMIIQPNNAEELLTRVFGFTFDKTSWEIHLIAQAPPSYHHDDHDRPVRHPKKKSKRSRRSRKTVSSEAASEAAPPESDASAGSAESAPADPTPSGGGDQPSSSDDSG